MQHLNMTSNDLTKLELAPAYRQVSLAISKLISSRQLRPGDWLPIETELAAQLGVNRSTIREGLRGLEHEGLVKREGKRLKVAIPPSDELAIRTSRALIMHEITFSELAEASSSLETIIAELAAERINDEDLELLEKNVEEMATCLDDTARVIELDVEFHNIISKAANNRALSLAREPTSLLFYPAGNIVLSRLHTEKRVLDAHRGILQALKLHNKVEVHSLMKRHMADFKRGFEAAGVSMESSVDSTSESLFPSEA